jgi:hypothetical protein
MDTGDDDRVVPDPKLDDVAALTEADRERPQPRGPFRRAIRHLAQGSKTGIDRVHRPAGG